MNAWASFLSDSLGIALPILAVALGGLYTEAAGSLNIALEGLIITGAVAFAAASGAGQTILLGFLVSIAVCSTLAVLIIRIHQKFSADAFVAALAVNLFVMGAAGIVSEHVFGTKGVVALPAVLSARIAPRFWADLPVLGALLFRQRGMTYLLGAASVVLALGFTRTPFGLRVRAAGMQEGALRISGVDPDRVRCYAYAVSGAACALAGIALTRSVGAWIPNISAGRGWVALVVIFLGGKRPGGIVLASLGFGLLFALSNAAQAFLAAPSELVLALPYTVTALAVLLGGARLNGKPSRY